MSHLPECWLTEGKFDAVCMCDRLRACEQRVLKDLVPNLHIADTQGFNRGLSQAREAVEGCRTDLRGYLGKTDALAAIDAQRESCWCVLSLSAIDALREDK